MSAPERIIFFLFQGLGGSDLSMSDQRELSRFEKDLAWYQNHANGEPSSSELSTLRGAVERLTQERDQMARMHEELGRAAAKVEAALLVCQQELDLTQRRLALSEECRNNLATGIGELQAEREAAQQAIRLLVKEMREADMDDHEFAIAQSWAETLAALLPESQS